MKKVRVKVPASTTNLGPGFDCLGLALKLYNLVEIEKTPGSKVTIEIEGEGEANLPKDERNIIFPALEVVFKRIGEKPGGLRIRQINNVPLGRGLGSSATTRLAGIAGANRLLGTQLSTREILSLATELEGHPDNAAASLLGGFVIVAHTSKGLQWIKMDFPASLKVLLVIPEILVPTRRARDVIPRMVPISDAVFNLSRLGIFLSSLTLKKWENLLFATQDRLHQPYRESLIPGMGKVFQAGKNAGARAVFLSGAGSGIAALVDKEEEKVAEAMREAFVSQGVRSKIMLLHTDKEGTLVD
jgi:homoserine kinase